MQSLLFCNITHCFVLDGQTGRHDAAGVVSSLNLVVISPWQDLQGHFNDTLHKIRYLSPKVTETFHSSQYYKADLSYDAYIR